MKKRNWYRLDNSAKIMPSTTTNLNTNVFRLSCTLTKQIDEKVLQEALDKTLIEFPMFLYEKFIFLRTYILYIIIVDFSSNFFTNYKIRFNIVLLNRKFIYNLEGIPYSNFFTEVMLLQIDIIVPSAISYSAAVH